MGQLVHKSVRKLIQEVLEQEVEDYLGRGYYERGGDKRRRYRTGFEKKKLHTAEVKVEVEAPQVRDTEETYRSGIMEQI